MNTALLVFAVISVAATIFIERCGRRCAVERAFEAGHRIGLRAGIMVMVRRTPPVGPRLKPLAPQQLRPSFRKVRLFPTQEIPS